MREPIVEREAVGADHAGQESGAERKRRDEIRERAKGCVADRDRAVFLIDHFDPKRHLADGLPADGVKATKYPPFNNRKNAASGSSGN